MMYSFYIPKLKFPRFNPNRKPDINSRRANLNPDRPTQHPYWDSIFVDWITEMALSTEELKYYYDILNNDHRLSDIIDRVVFQRAKFYGGGLVVGYDKQGRADEIPAQLQDGQFIFTAKAVREIGVDKLYKMLNEAENKGTT